MKDKQTLDHLEVRVIQIVYYHINLLVCHVVNISVLRPTTHPDSPIWLLLTHIQSLLCLPRGICKLVCARATQAGSGLSEASHAKYYGICIGCYRCCRAALWAAEVMRQEPGFHAGAKKKMAARRKRRNERRTGFRKRKAGRLYGGVGRGGCDLAGTGGTVIDPCVDAGYFFIFCSIHGLDSQYGALATNMAP